MGDLSHSLHDRMELGELSVRRRRGLQDMVDFSKIKVRRGPSDEVVFGAKRAIEVRIEDIRNACGLDLEAPVDTWFIDIDSWFVDVTLSSRLTLDLAKCDRIQLALEHV